MMDRRPRDKGPAIGRATLTVLNVADLATVHVALSGRAGAGFSGHAIMPLAGHELCCLQTTARAIGRAATLLEQIGKEAKQ
jgi:hypothetical protein